MSVLNLNLANIRLREKNDRKKDAIENLRMTKSNMNQKINRISHLVSIIVPFFFNRKAKS